jgi:hypothetical protein
MTKTNIQKLETANIQKLINEQKPQVSALKKALAELKSALNPFDLSKGSTILPSNKPL